MSEYQFYEFQAIDRPLSKAEMAELRALSTRATITGTRLQNEYHWGDFKGDPRDLMARYFDAHLYFANWGTRVLMFRLPTQFLGATTIAQYCCSDWLQVHTADKSTILEFRSENEAGEDWDEGPEGWLGILLPLRADLMGGDLRALYIGWLSCAEAGLLDDATGEPPVPVGLGTLSAALQGLADFLRVGEDVLAVAAERSNPRHEPTVGVAELTRWVAALPSDEKDAALIRLLDGDAPHLRTELLRRFRSAQTTANHPTETTAGRTVGELISAAEARADERHREQARRAAEAQQRQAREAAIARAHYLDGLVSRQEALWEQIERLIEVKRAKEYDQATQFLIDLHEVSIRTKTAETYRERLHLVRLRSAKKPSFLERLDKAALPR